MGQNFGPVYIYAENAVKHFLFQRSFFFYACQSIFVSHKIEYY